MIDLKATLSSDGTQKGLIAIRRLHESSSQCWIMTSKFGRKGGKDMLWSATYLHMISPPKWPNFTGHFIQETVVPMTESFVTVLTSITRYSR